MSDERWEVGPVLKRSWELFTKHLWTILGGVVVMAVVGGVFTGFDSGLDSLLASSSWSVTEGLLGLLKLAAFLVSWAVNLFLTLGFIRIYLKAVRDEGPQFSDLFAEGRHVVAGLVASLITLAGVVTGTMLLIVPGVILMLGWMFSLVALVDQELGPVEAIRESWRITRGEKGSLLLWFCVCCGLMLLGAMACGVGLFVATPICGLGTTLIYEDLLRQAEEEI